jgi:predicted DNA-binding transcriptional regulator AlpA
MTRELLLSSTGSTSTQRNPIAANKEGEGPKQPVAPHWVSPPPTCPAKTRQRLPATGPREQPRARGPPLDESAAMAGLETASTSSPPPAARWLRVAEVARRLRVHRSTLYRQIAAGLLPPPVRIAGAYCEHSGAVAWPQREIEKFEADLIAARDAHFARAADIAGKARK